jgi:putative endonuclease
MFRDRTFHVYILASESGVLYTGVTNDLFRRLWEHKRGEVPGFTQRYHVKKLVWFEMHGGPRSAIAREKQIKGWTRAKRVALIEEKNRQWGDLSSTLGGG